MFRHLVMWKFKEEASGRTKADNVRMARKALLTLPAKIPGILEWEVCENASEGPDACDLALIALFKDQEALATYQAHPEHLAVVEFLKKVRLTKTVVDGPKHD